MKRFVQYTMFVIGGAILVACIDFGIPTILPLKEEARLQATDLDFNLDSLSDIVKFDVPLQGSKIQAVWVGLSNSKRFEVQKWAEWEASDRMRVSIGYFNPDKLADIVKFDVPLQGTSRQPVWVGTSDSGQFKVSKWTEWDASDRMQVSTGYFNPDELADVIKFDVPLQGRSQQAVWVGSSDGKQFQVRKWAEWEASDGMRVLTGYFDHDTLMDVVKIDVPLQGEGRQAIWLGVSDGLQFNVRKWAEWEASDRMQVLAGNFNHDQLTDIVKFDVPLQGSMQKSVWVATSYSGEFQIEKWAEWEASDRMQVLTGDFNGDGFTDILKCDIPLQGNAQQGVWVGTSDGERFNVQQWTEWEASDRMKVLAGDFNADGFTDIVKFDAPLQGRSQQAIWVGLSNGKRFEVKKWANWEASDQMLVLSGGGEM